MLTPDASATPLSWLLSPVALGLLWLGGHLACRALPTPCRPATDLIAALIVLFFTTLACDALGIPITLASLAFGLALSVAIGLLVARRLGKPTPFLPRPRRPLPAWRSLGREAWWVVPCVLALVSVLARGVLDPLAGWDNLWRWNHLALIMRDTGSLAAYPPVSTEDFLAYPWCDGIPPLVSVSNLWIYLCAGSTHGGLIAARLVFELGLVALLVRRIARDLWGPAGARLALLALASSSLFLASVSIAQETGLTGVGVLALAATALAYHRAPRLSTACWLGVVASFAALCRDYNLLLLPLALGLLVLLRAPRRDLLAAAGLMFLLVSPWYARNWLHTGNPLFAHDLGGMFPTNAYHDYQMGEIRRFWAPSLDRDFIRSILLPLLAGAGLLLAAALPGLRALHRAARAVLLVPAGALLALWAISLPATAGGVVFSLRVLGPALPLLAVAAGWWATRRTAVRVFVVALLVLGATDAARRHWLFLLDPLSPPLPYAWDAWRKTDNIHARFSRAALWPALHASSGGGAIVADNPGFTVHAGRAGVPVRPLSSPELAAITDPASSASAEATRTALRAAGVRFLVLAEDTTFVRELHARHPRLGPLYASPPVGLFEGLRVYDLGPPSP